MESSKPLPIRLVLPKSWKSGAPGPDGIELYIDGHKIEGIHSITLPINLAQSHVVLDVKLVPIAGLQIEYRE